MPARGSAAAGSGGGGAPGGRRGRRRRLLLLVTGRGRGLARGQALRMRGRPGGRRGRAAGVLPPFPPPPLLLGACALWPVGSVGRGGRKRMRSVRCGVPTAAWG